MKQRDIGDGDRLGAMRSQEDHIVNQSRHKSGLGTQGHDALETNEKNANQRNEERNDSRFAGDMKAGVTNNQDGSDESGKSVPFNISVGYELGEEHGEDRYGGYADPGHDLP